MLAIKEGLKMNKNRIETKVVKSKAAGTESSIEVKLYADAELKECTHFSDVEKGYINLHLTIKAMDAERLKLDAPEKAADKELFKLLKRLSPDQLAAIQKMQPGK